ncbi:MAG: hypothetical protein V1494_08075 [Candidatus Diapherotrites archaeon]
MVGAIIPKMRQRIKRKRNRVSTFRGRLIRSGGEYPAQVLRLSGIDLGRRDLSRQQVLSEGKERRKYSKAQTLIAGREVGAANLMGGIDAKADDLGIRYGLNPGDRVTATRRGVVRKGRKLKDKPRRRIAD